MTELSYYFKRFFIATLFVRSISIVEPVRSAATAMHFCLDMCFFKRNTPNFFFYTMPIRMKKPCPPLPGADTARYLLISAGYF